MPKAKKSSSRVATKSPKKVSKKVSKKTTRVSKKAGIQSSKKKAIKFKKRKEQQEVIDPVFFRRCHHCDHINERSCEVLLCESCNKALAPFYYFDLNKVRTYTDDQMRDDSYEGEYKPIRGIALRW